MGRRNLSPLAAAAATAGLALAAPGAAQLSWRQVARGPATGAQTATTAFVAPSRRAAGRFEARLPVGAVGALDRIDFRRSLVVAVFGDFGCRDARVGVTSVARRGAVLVVGLALRALPPGQVECLALFPTFRLLALPKAELARPYPTRAEARLARA